MSWFEDLANRLLGVEDQPPTRGELEAARQPPPSPAFDPRPSGYDAGVQLYDAIGQMRQLRDEQGSRRMRAVRRERHHISDTEYIDRETVIEIEEGHNYKEWGY